jgi:hypothetical protein
MDQRNILLILSLSLSVDIVLLILFLILRPLAQEVILIFSDESVLIDIDIAHYLASSHVMQVILRVHLSGLVDMVLILMSFVDVLGSEVVKE